MHSAHSIGHKSTPFVDLGRQTLHTHQHSLTGEGGRTDRLGAGRGDDHTAHLPPQLRGHMVRASIILHWPFFVSFFSIKPDSMQVILSTNLLFSSEDCCWTLIVITENCSKQVFPLRLSSAGEHSGPTWGQWHICLALDKKWTGCSSWGAMCCDSSEEFPWKPQGQHFKTAVNLKQYLLSSWVFTGPPRVFIEEVLKSSNDSWGWS